MVLTRIDKCEVNFSAPARLMATPAPARQSIRFCGYEADVSAGQLRRDGIRVKLGHQPFRILVLLLQRAGEVVTREELRQQLWPENTFVGFEAGLNTAIKRLRTALRDPRYIETLPRVGYRFVAPVEQPLRVPVQIS